MKPFFLLLLVCLTLSAFSQDVDSTKIKVPVTLNVGQLSYIADCIGYWNPPSRMNLAIQIVGQMDTAYSGEAQLSQPITVLVESKLVVEIYQLMSNLNEGMAKSPNEAIKQELLPQVAAYPWLVRSLQNIDAAHEASYQNKVHNGLNFFLSILKP